MSRSLFPQRLRLRSETSGACASPEIPEEVGETPDASAQEHKCKRLRCGCQNRSCPGTGGKPAPDQTEQ